MHKIILFIFYVIALNLFLISEIFAYSTADFDDDPYDSSNYEALSTSAENRYVAEQYADNSTMYQPNVIQSRAYVKTSTKKTSHRKKSYHKSSYASRLPQTNNYGEKVIIINPRKHVWGAYSADGKLLRAGLATAGASWCPDIKRACRTRSGTFRIYTLGSRSCYSKRYPVGKGGAPMPYCMFFNGNQGLHGSHQLAEANLSHGCVRISVSDAEWVRFNFANIGTKVVVTSY